MASFLRQLKAILRQALEPARESGLPPRVAQAIHRHDATSEVLIKLIQLLVVSIWAILYALAPKTDANTAFSPVPYALAAYLALNLAGLVWAVKRGLPNWAVFVSIALDVLVLMLLIWSFHVQYMQPPSFYLKAPTLLYVFIFIALRALRFDVRFVLATGAAAVVGWLALVAYVVFSDPHDNMLTRDYVAYLTSNSILLGAEFDKIIAIVLVTGIIALALARAHVFLVRATAEGMVAQDFSRYFDENVAERIRHADSSAKPGEGQRREAAILFVDIRGFTPLAATLDAGEVVNMLTAYHRVVVPIIQRHGGSIDKFMGDGIMATFGASQDSATFAANALRAVDDIVAATGDWRGHPELARLSARCVNAAAAAGSVVFGTIGNEDRLEYTVIGAAVNLAAKLEKLNKEVGSVAICDTATLALARQQGYARDGAIGQAQARAGGQETDVAILH